MEANLTNESQSVGTTRAWSLVSPLLAFRPWPQAGPTAHRPAGQARGPGPAHGRSAHTCSASGRNQRARPCHRTHAVFYSASDGVRDSPQNSERAQVGSPVTSAQSQGGHPVIREVWPLDPFPPRFSPTETGSPGLEPGGLLPLRVEAPILSKPHPAWLSPQERVHSDLCV